MIVQCPACNSRYRIRDANIPPSGGKIRCPSCAHSFVVYPEPPEEDDSDRTSITNPNALSSLVSKMSSPAKPAAPATDDNHTATLDKDEMNRIRAFQAMAADLGDADDGTLEIKNPMEIWRKAQAALEGGETGEDSEADEYDAAPTEIVSADNLPNLPFPGMKPKLPTPGLPAPPKPSASPPVPSLPPLRPPVQEPVRAAAPSFQHNAPAFDDPFAPQPSANFAPAPQLPAPAQAPPIPAPAQAPPIPAPALAPPIPSPAMPQQYGDSTEQLSNPFTGVDSKYSPDASADILAAIEEVSLAYDDKPNITPDGAHQGPWKLKTDFGLTYEFPDVKSLRNWLSSRDEIDGFKLSADGINFFAVTDFPQFSRRPNVSQVGLQQPSELGAMPSDGYAPAALPNFNQPSFTPPPSSASQSGSFSGAVVPGQYASYHGGPLPPAPMGPPVQTSYRPPSSGAGQHKLLWAIFALLLVICVLVGLQTFGFVDLLTLAGFGKKQPVVVEVAPKIELVQPLDTPTVEDVNADIEGLLKEVRRDLKNKKIQTALDRLITVETLAPKRAEVFELRAQAFDALGDTDKAENARERAEELKASALGADPTTTPDGGVDSN